MKRDKFSLSHGKLLTCFMGALVPIACVEVLPGDSIQQSTSALVRLSPMLAPMMHRVEVAVHHWFVPNRLVWSAWEDFITGGPDGDDASVFPTIDFPGGGPEIGSLADYFGIPTDVAAGFAVSALPFRAYNLIFNEFYRDQDLTPPVAISTASGDDNTTGITLLNRAWEKDYFTSARPEPQKGDSVTIPLIGTAPVVQDGQMKFQSNVGTIRSMRLNTSGNFTGTPIPAIQEDMFYNAGLEVDLSGVAAITVHELREAMALQRFAEVRARFGSRYSEYLQYLGVYPQDSRLQRPEYLGGGKQTLQISEVLQTGVTTDGDDSEGVGNLKGHGIGAMRSNRYRRYIPEHGHVISLLSIRPRTLYTQGLPRMWNRRTREDFFQRELQHIGQQEVLNKELYASHSTPDGVFGYQDRYDEYRRCESWISGEFRSTLDYWHLGRIFGSDPALNADFVKCVPALRPFADQTSHPCQVAVHHSIQARRIVSASARSFIL